MPSGFCLVKEQADKFKRALKSKEIDPIKLGQMSSKERRAFLEKFVGKDNGIQVNSLFESKLLLKNQKAGYISWAKKVGGLSKQARRDLVSRIERLDKVLDPVSEKEFLQDLASTRLGTNVTMEEAKTIFEASKKVQQAKSLQLEDLTFKTEEQRLAYGRAKVKLINMVNDLKENNNFGINLNPGKLASSVAGNAKSIKAALDNSAIFRQGWKTLWTHPTVWARNAVKTFKDIVKTFGGKNVLDELNADIVSRPNYDLMVKAKLAVGTIEEAYPGTVLSKVPVLGRAYKASESAYTGFVHKTRADVFDRYIKIAQQRGTDLTDKELKAIGSMVNSLTGRASLPGDLERAANTFNNVFFSPRYLVSQVNTLSHVATGAGGSNFVRREAAINLLKVVSGTAGILAVANAVLPGSVETDSRSADFGKIKVGNTRFDVTGGLGSIVTLASRLITNSSKSSTTGAVTKLDTGDFGAKTKGDVVLDFLGNKLSPAASVLKDLWTGKDFDGKKPTLLGELDNLFMPLPVSTYQELQKDPNSADTLLSMIASSLGFGVNTYGTNEKDWSQKPTKAQGAFLEKVGNDKFKEANKKYNEEYDSWFVDFSKTDTYKNLDDEEKQYLLKTKRDNLQEKIFKDFGFTYKEKQTSESKKKNKELRKLAE